MFFRKKSILLTVTIMLLVLVSVLLLVVVWNINDESVLEVQPSQTLVLSVNETTRTLLPSTATATSSPTPAPTTTAAPTPTITATPEIPQGAAVVIGYSVAGRPLEVYRFGSGETRQMIIAGIHGGYESNTVELADQLITYLQENPDTVPADRTLYILRLMNPDGFAREFGVNGRANENGVDLNRNWDANWQAEWPRAYCWNSLPISAGTAAMSEPETQAVAKFVQEQAVSSIISFHSAGPGIYAGGQPDGPRSTSLAKTLSGANGYPYLDGPSLCVYTGMMADWAVTQGIPAVDVELPDHANPDFKMNLKALQAFLSWKQ